MKPVYIILVIFGILVFSLGAVVIITRVIINPPASWWWFVGFLIFYIVVSAIVGIIFLIIKLKKKKVSEVKINEKDAEIRAKNEVLFDNDNPDNFIVKNHLTYNVGEPGKERTPVLWLTGTGSETNNKIDVLINLDKPSAPISKLFNGTKDEVNEAVRLKAERPEEIYRVERLSGVDEFGRPITTVRTTKSSVTEEKKIEEEKKAEEMEAF